MYVNTSGKLTVQSNVPAAGEWKKLLALVRDPSSLLIGNTPVTKPVSFGAMPKAVHVSVIDHDVAGSLLAVVKGVYAPPLLRNDQWPESVLGELKTHTHRYLAALTERSHEMKGRTVLYVPDEPEMYMGQGMGEEVTGGHGEVSEKSIETASTKKDLVQRLESTVIHWTRQIREVLRETAGGAHTVDSGADRLKGAGGGEPGSDDSNDSTNGSDGPLSEVTFWHSRADDLAGIQGQLDDEKILTVTRVLKRARSTYLEPFLELRDLVRYESEASSDNARFLKTLVEPCEALAKASAAEVAQLLPGIANRVRLIWNCSSHYNKPGRVFGLLRKISKEVTRRCAVSISVDAILAGDVVSTSKALQASLEACHAWKSSFEFTRTAVNKRHADNRDMQWPWSQSSLFAQLDAFEQRCKDLLDVCAAQAQFAPGSQVPVFGGSQGFEISKSFGDIRDAFQVLNGELRTSGSTNTALDVTDGTWHDVFNNFSHGVKDLEVRFQNVMTSSVESARGDLTSFVERVDALRGMSVGSSSSPIGRCADKLTSELYQAFATELAAVKKHFDTHRENPPVHPSMPRRAGAASWALSQRSRLQIPWNKLVDASGSWLVNSGVGDSKDSSSSKELESLTQAFEATLPQFEKFAKEQHALWVTHVENKVTPSVKQRLENRLLAITDFDYDASGSSYLLQVNFDKELTYAVEETKHFERMYFQIPSTCAELNSHKEKYRVLREDVLQLVTHYNSVISRLDGNEGKLFRDRLSVLDRKIAPGLQKVHWQSSKSVSEFYMTEALKQVGDTKDQVDAFKDAMAEVGKCCDKISETKLIARTEKRVYAEGEFSEAQVTRRTEVIGTFKSLRASMETTLKKTFRSIFQRDSAQVHSEWKNLLTRVDQQILTALKLAVKNSLRDLSKALHGDAKTRETAALFGVAAVLKSSKSSGAGADASMGKQSSVTLKPAVADIRTFLHETCRDAVAITKEVERFVTGPSDDSDSDEDEATQSFFDIIFSDADTLKRVLAVDDGASLVIDEANKFVQSWEKQYGHVWLVDKHTHMTEYAADKPSLSKFEHDITKFRDLASDVRNELNTKHMLFLRLDCEPLVDVVSRHCEKWSESFLQLLNDTCRGELNRLYEYFEHGSTELRTPPQKLEELANKVAMHKRFLLERDETHLSFGPIKAQYATLEKFEWPNVSETEKERLEKLDFNWTKFVDMISETEVSLEEHKEGFRDKLSRMVDTLVKDVDEFKENFTATAPKSVQDAVTHDAMKSAENTLDEFTSKIETCRQREVELKKGLDIFNALAPKLEPLLFIEDEMIRLKALWDLIKEWLSEYDVWSLGKFRDLKVEDMETTAQTINKNVVKLGKKIAESNSETAVTVEWPSWRSLKDKIDGFKKTMPLVMDLRNPAIRERHWGQVMEKCGAKFDPHGDDFTLGRVTDLELHKHDEWIAELSGNATKELAIETSLATITETWQNLTMDMVPFKDNRPDVFKLRGTEDVYVALEDNIVTLSTMKASKFFMVFEQPIANWEKKLLLVSEMLDLVVKVQTAWMYLENIFVGSEDIRMQLPRESIMFDDVNTSFIHEMKSMKAKEVVITACTGSLPDPVTPISNQTLEQFTKMDEKLEKIQKSLEAYLEQKRQQFPRFYFISSDDLLEILGQAKDPLNVQPHFKGMFEGVKKLEMFSPGDGGRRNYASTLMHSPDGETLNFDEEVPTHGRPEEWLNKVEAAMYKACKTSLKDTLEHSKGMTKEKWVKQFPGQMIISAGCVVWTAECEKALSEKDKAKAAIKMLKKKWASYLTKLVTLTRSKLDKVNRKKVVALITIEVHARDSIEKLSKSGCDAITDFEWVSQLRFYWDHEKDDCVVKQVLSVFEYGYEYQGNNGRLVVTPLTDRCYMTLGAAMFTRRGGNPLGPAGTGKTETVKDFGKALGTYTSHEILLAFSFSFVTSVSSFS